MTPEETASIVVRDTGNVLIAETVASLYESAADGNEWQKHWESVARLL